MKYMILITSMIFATPALSYEFLHTCQPYFGIDGQWHSMNNSKTGFDLDTDVGPRLPNVAPAAQVIPSPPTVLPNKTHYGAPVLNIYGGIKFNPWFAAETGYSVNMPKNYHTYKLMKNSLHTSLILFMPINPNIELIGGFGFSSLRHVVEPLNKNCFIHIKERNSLTKIVPRAIAGMQLYSFENFCFRLSVCWENSKKMRIPGFNFHDSLHYGIGLQYKL